VIKLSAVDNGYKCNTTLKTSAESLNLRFFFNSLLSTNVYNDNDVVNNNNNNNNDCYYYYLLFYSKNLKQIYSKKRKNIVLVV